MTRYFHIAHTASSRMQPLSIHSAYLPSCRKRLNCSYAEPDQRRNLDSSSHIGYDPILNAHKVHVEAIDHSTILFLDPSLLQHGNYSTTPVITTIPSRILDLVGDPDEVRATADTYFARIHTWMPFIAKRRVYDTYLHVNLPSHPDLVFLFLAQKLITTLSSTGSQTMRTPLYSATKHFHLELETSSMLSVPLLQGNLLIALYEIGHAIYPAAYLTIGSCARYAYALGINIKGVSTRRVTTMVEVEERRRIWWAIVVLDRSVSRIMQISVQCIDSISASSVSVAQVVRLQHQSLTSTNFYLLMTQLGIKVYVVTLSTLNVLLIHLTRLYHWTAQQLCHRRSHRTCPSSHFSARQHGFWAKYLSTFPRSRLWRITLACS